MGAGSDEAGAAMMTSIIAKKHAGTSGYTTGRSKTRAVLTSRRPFDQEAKKTWQSTIADRFGEAVE